MPRIALLGSGLPSRRAAFFLCAVLAGVAIGCDDSRSPVTPVSPTPPPTTPTSPATPSLPTVTGLVLSSATVPGGLDVTATVTLSAAAPTAGTTINLASNNAAVAVPATALIAAGATTANVTFTTRDVRDLTRATITATSNNTTASAELIVTPVPREAAGFRIEPDSLLGGANATGRIFLSTFIAASSEIAPAAIGDVVITLTSSDPSVQVPASVAVAAGQTEATFPITTTRVSRDVNVLLTASSGGQTRTSGLLVTSPAPTLSAISPASGPAAGGMAITLTGTRLTGATAVTMGGNPASKVVVVNATTVTAETPAHAAGAVDVVVTTPDGGTTLSNAYTYLTPAPAPAPQALTPALTASAPTSGVILGGTAVTLTGTNLTGATAVTFDGIAATSVVVVNATTITATTPAHALGAVSVRVTTPEGTATLASGYQYVSGSTLTAVNSNSGSASGGTGITVTGTGLTGATALTVGGVAATSVNVVNATTVTAVTPAHATGANDVVISTPAGGATLTNGFTFLTTAVGQDAYGGVIAALNGGLNNLIAATADNSTGVAWTSGIATIGAAGQSTTDGASNTAAIVAALGAALNYAAGVCSAYEVDSQANTPCQAGNTCYNDWFLPAGSNQTATGQLAALFTNRAAIGGFAASNYWSSTEFAGNPLSNAFLQDFTSGIESSTSKLLLRRVRCVRAFTP